MHHLKHTPKPHAHKMQNPTCTLFGDKVQRANIWNKTQQCISNSTTTINSNSISNSYQHTATTATTAATTATTTTAQPPINNHNTNENYNKHGKPQAVVSTNTPAEQPTTQVQACQCISGRCRTQWRTGQHPTACWVAVTTPKPPQNQNWQLETKTRSTVPFVICTSIQKSDNGCGRGHLQAWCLVVWLRYCSCTCLLTHWFTYFPPTDSLTYSLTKMPNHLWWRASTLQNHDCEQLMISTSVKHQCKAVALI